MTKIYHVDLTDEERANLLELIRNGKLPPRKATRARILLLADESKTDEEIQEALRTSRSRVERTRERFVFVKGSLKRKTQGIAKIT